VQRENKLYAERLRLKAQAEALAAGTATLTDQLSPEARSKLRFAWIDVTSHQVFSQTHGEFESYIARRTLEDLAFPLKPDMMASHDRTATNEQLLSLIEVEHEILSLLAANLGFGTAPYPGPSPEWVAIASAAPEKFRTRVNEILKDHIVRFYLHQNSQLVPVDSQEMHSAVVERTLYLLHSQPRFAQAEAAYQDALRELRDEHPDDAITDAAGALEQALRTLGCTGNSLGELRKSGQKLGVLKADDDRITGVIGQTIDWVKDKRNAGEAHGVDANYSLSDAWLVVHMVGALVIRLAEASD
jgi:hypothetical protein